MTYHDRLEEAPSVPFKVAPGVYEVDFDNFDPSVVPLPPHIREVDFDSYSPPCSSPLAWDTGLLLRGRTFGSGLNLPLKMKPKQAAVQEPRWTELREQTPKLFNAASFLIWSKGKHFNTLITLSAEQLGFSDNAAFMKLMPVWQKEMARWMNNGTDRFRRRASRKCVQEASQPHYWISVAEYARTKGFHVHVLCVLPPGLKDAFAAKAWHWWRKHAKQVPTKAALDFKCRWPKQQRSQFARHVYLLRYVLKTTADMPVLDRHGRQWSLRRVVWAKPNDCSPVQVMVPQLTGICRALSAKAQADEGFESDLGRRDFSFVYSNWEYGMWKDRMEQERMGMLLNSLLP